MRVSKPHRKVNKAVKAHKAGRRVQPHGPKPIIGADLKIYKPLCEVTDEAGSFVKNGDHAKPLRLDQSLNHSWIDMKGMRYVVSLKFTDCSIPRTRHSVKPLTEEDHRVRSSFSYQTNALFNITNAANRKIKTYNQKIDNFIKYFSAFRRLSFLIQHMGKCCVIGDIRKSEVHQLHFLNAPWRPTILWSMSF